MNDNLIGLIFCSGKGTRLYPITYEIPKPLIKIHKEITFLDKNIQFLINQGIKTIYINYSYGEDLFKAIATKYPQIYFHYIHEPQPLGHGNTISKVINAYSKLHQNFKVLAINGDTILSTLSLDFHKEVFDIKESIRIYGDSNLTSQPKNLIIKEDRVIGFQGSTKDYLYNGVITKDFEKQNNIGVYLISEKIGCEIPKSDDEFLGLFGVDDLLERLQNRGFYAKYKEVNVTGYASVNTQEDLDKIIKQLQKDDI